MSGGRWESTLRPPDPADDYSRFPAHRLRAGARCHRVHAAEHGPWWFSSGVGRFDLRAPRGTANLASTPTVAVCEALGPVLLGHGGTVFLPSAAVRDRVVTTLSTTGRTLADLARDAGRAFGVVPGEATAPQPDGYVTTQAWARAFDAARFEGIRSPSRFSASGCCVYLFGPAGAHAAGEVHDQEPLEMFIRTHMQWVHIDAVPDSRSLIIDP